MRRKLLICGGVLLLAAALCLAVCYLEEDRRAGETAAQVAGRIKSEMKRSPPPPPSISKAPEPESTVEPTPNPTPTPTPLPSYLLDPTMEMPVTEIDGHSYIGTLEIPVLELSLPVMDAWSYPNLKLSPCRYKGSAYLDDLIVAGHNYKTHFGHLYQLRAGDEVLFTDADGNLFSYTVAEVTKLGPRAVEEMETGDWDLTLFTCTVGGKARVTVRCTRAAETPDAEQDAGEEQ